MRKKIGIAFATAFMGMFANIEGMVCQRIELGVEILANEKGDIIDKRLACISGKMPDSPKKTSEAGIWPYYMNASIAVSVLKERSDDKSKIESLVRLNAKNFIEKSNMFFEKEENQRNAALLLALNAKNEKERRSCIIPSCGFMWRFAFAFTNYKSITCPFEWKYISTGAFFGCSQLYEVELGANIRKIEEYAFGNCSNLKSITLPCWTAYVARDAFAGWTEKQTVYVYKSLQYYVDYNHTDGSRTYKNIADTEDRYFEGKAKIKIYGKESTFFYTPRLGRNKKQDSVVTVPEKTNEHTINTIGFRAFGTNDDITCLSLPNTIKVIEAEACCAKSKLRDVKISPSSELEIIEKFAFCNCGKLNYFFIPKNVRYLGPEAFYYCSELSKVEIDTDSHLQEIGDFCFSSTALESFVLPASVKKIGRGAFGRNEHFQIFEISENSNLERINLDAFRGCPDLLLMIPASARKLVKK